MTSINPTQLKNFLPVSKLGQGAFSTVYKVKRINDGEIYALKKIKMQKLKPKQKQNSLNQIRILASIKSKFIISYKEAFYDHTLNLLCIVMEYANGGDLQNKIASHEKARTKFQEKQVWKAASQILMGLYKLHQNGILHRDLKSANVFISNQIYKLGDLNVSKVNYQKDQLARTQTGTPYYASPEVWRDQPYDNKCDIWSLGCLLYEMCCLRPPFQGTDLDQLYQVVQIGRYRQIPSIYSKDLSSLIRRCLTVNPKQRPSAKQLLQCFFQLKQKFIQFLKKGQFQNQSNLLNTIILPYDLKDLSKNLPTSQYQVEIKEQPKTMYKQNDQQVKQTVILRNKDKISEQQKKVGLHQKIKSHFAKIPRNDTRKRPQRPYTAQKPHRIHQNIKQLRPISAKMIERNKYLRQPQRNPIHKLKNLERQKNQKKTNNSYSLQQKIRCQRKSPIYQAKPYSNISNKIMDIKINNQQDLHFKNISQSKQRKRIQQKRPNSLNRAIIDRYQSSEKIKQNNSHMLIEQQMYKKCRQNSIKKIASLQNKVKIIRQQRKQRNNSFQKNKENLSCIIKPTYKSKITIEDTIDIKKQLHNKIKQHSEVFKIKNKQKTPVYMPVISCRQMDLTQLNNNIDVSQIKKQSYANQIMDIGHVLKPITQNIQKHLQVRRNNISTNRYRYVVSAEAKRAKSLISQNNITNTIQSIQGQRNKITSQKVQKKVGYIRKMPSSILPSINRSNNSKSMIESSQNKYLESIDKKYKRQQIASLDSLKPNQSSNIIQDNQTIMRLKKRIKNRMICNRQIEQKIYAKKPFQKGYLNNSSINQQYNRMIRQNSIQKNQRVY